MTTLDDRQPAGPPLGDRPAVSHRLGPLADIPLGEGRAYTVAGEQIAVFRPRAGGVYALSAACPHAGGPLADGQLDGTVLVCPLHQHVFELATGCSRTGQPPARTHPVQVDAAGQLVVWLPAAEPGLPDLAEVAQLRAVRAEDVVDLAGEPGLLGGQ